MPCLHAKLLPCLALVEWVSWCCTTELFHTFSLDCLRGSICWKKTGGFIRLIVQGFIIIIFKFNIHLFWASWVFVTFLFPEVRVHSLQNVKIRSPFFIIVAALGLAALKNHTVLRFLGFIWLFTMDPVSLTFLLKWVNNCWWGWQNRIDLGKCTHQYDEKRGIIVSLLFVV